MTFLFIMPSLLSSILFLKTMTTTTVAAQPQPQQVRFGRSVQKRSSSTPLQRIRDVNVMSPKVPLRIDDWSDPSTLRHRRKLTSKPPMFSDMLVNEMLSYPISISMSLPSSFEFDFDNTPIIITTDPTNTASTSPPSSLPDITTIPLTSSDHTEESHYVKIMVSANNERRVFHPYSISVYSTLLPLSSLRCPLSHSSLNTSVNAPDLNSIPIRAWCR
jgi:hypothetical protein